MKESLIELKKKITSLDINVGIVGLGYVGLPLAVEFAKKGIITYGFDIDEQKVKSLENGINYIQDIEDDLLEQVVYDKKLIATTDFSLINKCDGIFICVPTPFTPNKDPDISFIVNAAKEISKYLRKEQIIILKSTTFPGTTEEILKPILEESSLKAGEDFFLAFSPERIDPGNKNWKTHNTPVVVGGINQESTELASALHNLVVSMIKQVSTPSIAEMEKLLENIFRSVNIALVNEMAQLCDRLGINVWEVVDAAATKPFGFMPFYPGPGIGGHCILIDPYYLAWKAREKDFVTNFIQLAAEINEDMPFYVESMVIKEIAKQEVSLKNAKILILGMAFKKDVDDLRHSPALKVAELLAKDNISQIDYYDPYIPSIKLNGMELNSLKEINPKVLANYDVCVITTDHSVFDYEMIAANSKVVVDTRNACKNIKSRENIILLGEGK
ncbi:MAG: nucleotide sugar dehydrogenase [Candidatus Kapaibacteriota bacterium]